MRLSHLLPMFSFLVVLTVSPPVNAFPSTQVTSADFTEIEAFLKQELYDLAVSELEKIKEEHSGNADYWVLLAYSQRQSGDVDSSRESYLKAFEIDPTHKRGRNYYGHLHLTIGDVAGAEEQLAFLNALCPSDCPERKDLADAIENFKTGDPYDAYKY